MTNPKLQGEAASAYRRVGSLYERLGQDAEAEKANARAVEIFEGLVKAVPDEPSYRLKLVDTYLMADPWSADPATLPTLETQLDRARLLVDGLVAGLRGPAYTQAQVQFTRSSARSGSFWGGTTTPSALPAGDRLRRGTDRPGASALPLPGSTGR